MKTIPHFTLDESEAVGSALDEAGVAYERQNVIVSGSRAVYVFQIADDRFADAIQAIKSFFGFLDGPVEAVSGVCPACGVNVSNVFECPECGLSLSFDPRDLMQSHPFTVFLNQIEQSGVLQR